MSLFNTIGTYVYPVASCYPGPSPLYVANAIGGIVGGIATISLNLFHKFEALPFTTIKSAEQAAEKIQSYCNTLRKLKTGDHEFTKEGVTGSDKVRWLLSLPFVVGPEKAAYLAAARAKAFFNRKPIGIRETEGFKSIEDTLRQGPIFKALETKKEELKKQRKGGVNIDAKINSFFEDVEQILIEKMPATAASAPTLSDTIGFGLQWGTQLAITWYGRWMVYQWAVDYIPSSPYHVLYYGSMLAAAYAYCKGLEWTSRAQMQSELGTTDNKKDCRSHLNAEIIDKIKDKAYTTLLFDNELQTAHTDKLDALKTTLEGISRANALALKGTVDERLGYITPPTPRKNQNPQPATIATTVATAPAVPIATAATAPTVPVVTAAPAPTAQALPLQPPVVQQMPPVYQQGMYPPQQFYPWPQYGGGWPSFGPPQVMAPGGYFQPQPVAPVAQPSKPNNARKVIVDPTTRVASDLPLERDDKKEAPAKRFNLADLALHKTTEVRDRVPLPEYHVFATSSKEALKLFENNITKLALDDDDEALAFLAELDRHKQTILATYMPVAEKENTSLIPTFSSALELIARAKTFVQQQMNPEPKLPSPGLSKSAAARELHFGSTTPLRGAGAAPGINSTMFSPVKETGAAARMLDSETK